jgi:hypothetical protein
MENNWHTWRQKRLPTLLHLPAAPSSPTSQVSAGSSTTRFAPLRVSSQTHLTTQVASDHCVASRTIILNTDDCLLASTWDYAGTTRPFSRSLSPLRHFPRGGRGVMWEVPTRVYSHSVCACIVLCGWSPWDVSFSRSEYF